MVEMGLIELFQNFTPDPNSMPAASSTSAPKVAINSAGLNQIPRPHQPGASSLTQLSEGVVLTAWCD